MNEQIDLVPARMVNEYVYCPRLCYLQWVQQRWEHNDDTALGAFRHHSVDGKGGRMPTPGEESPPDATFSVALSDPGWGLSGVVDRVDHTGGRAIPVDLKKGHPRMDGTAWPADQAQIWCYAALLEAAGFVVGEGHVSYDEGHTRIPVVWDDTARVSLRATLSEMRMAMGRTEAPAPLLDDSRCPRCSLAGLCLPDEMNALLHRSQAELRRILPRNPDARPLYVVEQGSVVRVKGGRIQVTLKDEVVADLRLIDVQHVCVVGHVQITTEALTRLWAVGATVIWLSYGGWLNGWSQAHPGKYVDLRRQQVARATSGGAQIASAIIAGKIRNQRTMLMRNAKQCVSTHVLASLKQLAMDASACDDTASLLGYEGTAARMYFEHFAMMLSDQHWRDSFRQAGRTRRPPTDPVNALLSFCYSLLIKDLVVACLAVGLDPYLGVLHRSRYGRPAMALDLAEEFRPIIADSVVIQVLNNHEVDEKSFIERNAGVQLTSAGRKAVLEAYERRVQQEFKHPTFGYRISYRRALEVQARIMAAVFVGELQDYPPVVTR